MLNKILPAEWEPQSGVQLTWPHAETDWANDLDEVSLCFGQIAKHISWFEKVIIVCKDELFVNEYLQGGKKENIHFYGIESNDTWARDHGGIAVLKNNQPVIVDFKFNGWGLKFVSDKDNLITSKLIGMGAYVDDVQRENQLGFVLEGGSIESDGEGTILTTAECLLSPNRNGNFSQREIEEYLKSTLGAERVLWLNHGFLQGDDTDSHIDTLVRFVDTETIAYVKCDDRADIHFDALEKMEEELKCFVTKQGKPYRLISFPMADPVYCDGERLPATYANFLIINDAVLYPTYDSLKDKLVWEILKEAFPGREIIGINCLSLIKQHGSLHCVTMQFPEGFLK
ncbi:agmatine deiminase family protein [Marinilabiliaceae bacterium JC017]|nr:agmatine deiminase family protein [Marinilabiliaceae bacterium JC017]